MERIISVSVNNPWSASANGRLGVINGLAGDSATGAGGAAGRAGWACSRIFLAAKRERLSWGPRECIFYSSARALPSGKLNFTIFNSFFDLPATSVKSQTSEYSKYRGRY